MSSGTGGSGAVTCSNTDKSIIPIDSTGWVAAQCDNYAIQGAWYCYTDGMTQTSCVANKPPYDAAQKGMCLTGTSLGAVAGTYGAAIGLSLNDSGGTPDVKSAWDATAHNVVGFEVTVAGTFSPLDLRVGFKDAAAGANDVSPFYPVIGPGTYQIMFSQASVPASWMVANAGAAVMPSNLTDISFQIAGDEKASVSFDFCITGLKPILSGGSSTGTGGSSGGTGTGGSSGGNSCTATTPFASGTSKCGNTDFIEGVGNYAVQVDTYNGGSDCVVATTGSGCIGFTATPNMNISGNTPGGYPSVVYGWHYGNYHGGYTSAKQISSIGMIPSNWSFTVPTDTNNNVKYDVSYDIWANQSGGSPSAPDANTLELMIWLDETSDVVPAGSPLAGGTTATIAGQTWQIYTGMVSAWHYIAYKRSPSTTPFNSVDLKLFLTDATTRSVGVTNSWYLLSVEAGFEIWKGSSSTPFTTTGYSVSVN